MFNLVRFIDETTSNYSGAVFLGPVDVRIVFVAANASNSSVASLKDYIDVTRAKSKASSLA